MPALEKLTAMGGTAGSSASCSQPACVPISTVSPSATSGSNKPVAGHIRKWLRSGTCTRRVRRLASSGAAGSRPRWRSTALVPASATASDVCETKPPPPSSVAIIGTPCRSQAADSERVSAVAPTTIEIGAANASAIAAFAAAIGPPA